MAACPLQSRNHYHVVFTHPEGVELAQGSTLPLRIGTMTRPDLKTNPGRAARPKLIGPNPPAPGIAYDRMACLAEWIIVDLLHSSTSEGALAAREECIGDPSVFPSQAEASP